MKNVLLTGGLGYIGTKFIEKFNKKYDIKVFDTGYFTNSKKNINKNFSDIRNLRKNDLLNIDYVVHMSELSNDPLGNLNSNLTLEVNHIATKNLLDLCKGTNVKKFIYMSSASVYGYSETLSSENSKVNPLTEYAKAKIFNENYIKENDFDFESIILRNSTAFGFSKNLRLDLVINDLTFSGFFYNKIKLISDGTPKRPFVHISDICEIIGRFLLEDRNFNKETFNIGTDELNLSIKEVVEKISAYLNIDNIQFGAYNPDQRSYFLNFEKLKKTFHDFNFEYNLDKGIDDLIENFKNYKLSGNEIRIDKIKKLLENGELNEKLFWI